MDLLGGEHTILAVCGECRESFSRAVKRCPQCGWEIPKQEFDRLEEVERQRRMHSDKASDRSILSDAPETHIISDVKVSRHCKPGSPDSLVVRYRCGLRVFREWVCLDHDGFAGREAQLWWKRRFGMFGTKGGRATVDDALSSLFTEQTLNEYTKTITVKRAGKYFQVIDYNQPAKGTV